MDFKLIHTMPKVPLVPCYTSHISSPKVETATEIINLEFQLEIIRSAERSDEWDIEAFRSERDIRNARLEQLRGCLEESMSASDNQLSTTPEGMCFKTHGDGKTGQSIASFPYELLSAVFKNAPNDATQRLRFATSVSQVSHYWHAAAMHIPFLWSGIYLGRGVGRKYQEFLPRALQISQSHPLDIMINLKDVDDHHAVQAQFALLILEISRWRTFAYEGDYPSHISKFVKPLANLFAPILKSFDLCIDFREEERNPSIDLFGGGAPMLSVIRIGGVVPFACLPPLSAVTYLCIAEAKPRARASEFAKILRCSTLLVSLHLDAEILRSDQWYQLARQGRKIDIPSLRVLIFTADASPKYYIDSILNVIRCPGLQSMTITAWDTLLRRKRLIEIPLVQAQILPVYSALRSLELRGIDCLKFAENYDFSYLPALDTISLIRCDSPIAFLRMLLPSVDEDSITGDSVWPLLRVIKLSHLGVEEFDGLCDIISYRHAGGDKCVEIDPVSLRKFPEKVEWMNQRVPVRRGRHVAYHVNYFPLPSV